MTWLTLQLDESEGSLEFANGRQAQEWLERELKNWSWIWESNLELGTVGRNAFSSIQRNFVGAKTLIERELANEQATSETQNHINAMFNANNGTGVYASSSGDGQRLLGISNDLGPDGGRWAFKAAKGTVNFQQLGNLEDMTLLMRVAQTDERVEGDLGKTFRKERANYRREVTKLENRVRRLEAERAKERTKSAAHARRLTRHLLERSRSRWKDDEVEIKSKMNKALGDIAATEDHYRNQMALLAPVQYWKGKANSHGKWELGYGAMGLAYFGLAVVAIIAGAGCAIQFLQNFSGENETSAYLIVGAALLGGTTFLFWLGRVIAKLFLSEHHLRVDCQEKAIMTQAFLSMDTDDNFGETERAIVLASIFHSSPDGIVKDEGPSDLAGTATG